VTAIAGDGCNDLRLLLRPVLRFPRNNKVLEQTVFRWIAEYGYGAIFCLLMLGIIGLPVPDETLLMFSGYLVFKKQLRVGPVLVVAFLGTVCGITVSYMLGRTFGLQLIHRYGSYFHLTAARLARAHRWLEHAGAWSLTFGYYLPGVRHLTAYVAGASDLSPTVFSLFAYSGGALWATTFILVGYFLGNEWSRASQQIRFYAWIATAAVAVLLLVYFGVGQMRRRRRAQARAGT
jgi:membrane protein DedA with SNARE-associated domain